MSDYTPSAERVRQAYLEHYEFRRAAPGNGGKLNKYPDELETEFDRWLASVKAEGWDECLESLRPELEHELLYVKTVNPYREEVNDAKPRAMQ